MPRKKAPPQRTVGRERVTIRVTPFAGQVQIPGWIESGCLDTVAGGPARGVRVEIDRPLDNSDKLSDYRYAIQCLDRQGYRNVVICFADGSRYDMRKMTAVS